MSENRNALRVFIKLRHGLKLILHCPLRNELLVRREVTCQWKHSNQVHADEILDKHNPTRIVPGHGLASQYSCISFILYSSSADLSPKPWHTRPVYICPHYEMDLTSTTSHR